MNNDIQVKQEAPERIYLHNPWNVEQAPCGCGKDIPYVPESALATVRREQRETALRDLLMVAKANLKIGPTDALDTGWNLALAEIITALEASANQKEGMNG